MKLKKFKFGLILILSVFAFSCASTPKNQDEDVSTEISQEEVPSEQENESSENSEELASSENEVSAEDLQQEPLQEEEIPAEKVTPDELEILPELEVETEEEFEEPELEAEPEVQDAVPEPEQPDTTVNEENQTDSSEKKDSSSEYGIQETMENTSELTEAENKADTENASSSSDSEMNVLDENSEAETEITEQEKEKNAVKKEISPSRSITIGKNQLINIVYPGKGWIYQGNIDEEGNIDSRNRNFIFGGRKLGAENYTFTLRSRTAGKFLLHFFKNDGLTGDYIDDYLEVIVDESKASASEAITAPSYAETVPPKVSISADKIKEEHKKKLREQKEEELARQAQEKTQENSKSGKSSAGITELSSEQEKISTTIQTNGKTQETAPAAETVSSGSTAAAVNRASSQKPKENAKVEEYSEQALEKMNESALLKTASKLYDSKDYENALKVITKFFDKASGKIDEGLYLQGQILEAKSPVQNIKDAIESYDLVVKNYPASPFWEKARNRKTFLQRFYINIR